MREEKEKYWNLFMETLPREKLEKIELKNFVQMVKYALKHSPFYKKKLKEAGVVPEEIKSLEDIRKIPLTDKEELRIAQENRKPYLYGELLGVASSELSVFHQTSGTTGRPVYVPETYESWQWRIEAWCYILYGMGFRNTDRVFIPFGYNVYVAFWEGHYAAEKLGCEVVPGGALDTKGRLNKMQEVKATVFWG